MFLAAHAALELNFFSRRSRKMVFAAFIAPDPGQNMEIADKTDTFHGL